MDDELILVADAMDVWFQLPARMMVQRFEDLGGKVIAGAEKVCYPNRESSVSRRWECKCRQIAEIRGID